MGKDMNKRALKALKESIEHWYRISECMTDADIKREGYRAGSCELCKEFLSCDGCPVKEKTGYRYCDKSPYYAAEYSLDNWRSTGIWSEQDQANLVAEIRFLEGLLP